MNKLRDELLLIDSTHDSEVSAMRINSSDGVYHIAAFVGKPEGDEHG
jgi:glycerol kinase